jgi:phosphoribosylamine--glycine ligase
MRRWAIPTGAAELFSSHDEARRYVETAPLPLVVKADGLAAGKGVVVCSTRDEALSALRDCMERQVFGPAGETVLIEEFLSGPEVSVFTFTDGTHVSPLVAACDYKRIDDGDQGPNTGGMGSYSPPPFWDASLSNRVMAEIMAPAVRALAAEGCPFTGVLYGGLILTQDGPKVIEFNCRLGDPETQVVMPRLTSDLAEILLATANGTVDLSAVEWSDEACVGVVMASRGYPGTYQRGYPVSGLGSLDPGVVAFHAGTRTDVGPSGEVVTNGGRVVAVAALGESIEAARARAYANVERVGFEGAHYRKDIALLSLPTI